MALIPDLSLNNTILVETQGKTGVRVHTQNEIKEFVLPRIVAVPDTIGAGDTFFSAFSTFIIRNYTIPEAIDEAFKETCQFLQSKLQ